MSGKTPGLPERLSYEPDDGLGVTDAKTGHLLAETHDDALAAEIARRWNAHGALLAALRDLAQLVSQGYPREDIAVQRSLKDACDLLAKIGGAS